MFAFSKKLFLVSMHRKSSLHKAEVLTGCSKLSKQEYFCYISSSSSVGFL